MMKFKKETALNLTLEGSVGSFNVGKGRSDQNSLEVKYFLTHVGLDFSFGSNEAVLSHLAPVREIFDFEQLDFDEIMQRDIDDSRVSGELIPYLLDSKSSDLVKLFPPVIVVVLPLQEQNPRPAGLYPKVEEAEISKPEDEHKNHVLRAGSIGQEVFQFEQPFVDGKLIHHDFVRFKLNTHKTRLVIIDGQHRAMALLALYRNLKDEWSDEKRAPFKEYYAEWTPKYIQEFNLKEINLPVMFCTFPQLCEGYGGEFDLKKASRIIFLTLNKTARKVSNSRNILLDDNDLIALFLRRCLFEIKQKTHRSQYSLRIFNVELDQFEDRLKTQNPITLTGVNHIYYLIEHLLLNEGNNDVNGAKPRSGKFSKRKDLNRYGAMDQDRLDGRNLLGDEVAAATTRDAFTLEAAKTLAQRFDSKYGSFIVSAFENFHPYELHNRAVLNLESQLEAHEDRKLRPILFEGQGIGRVFEAHRNNLHQKLKEGAFETDVPKIKELSQRLDDTAKRIANGITKFRNYRVTKFLESVTDKRKLKDDNGNWHPKIVSLINDLYDNVFTTVAFETALICGFFGEIEQTNQVLRKENKDPLNAQEYFDEYMKQLNDFFIPTSVSQFKKLVSLFAGEFEGEISDGKLAPTHRTFRSVVYRGEMQPDQWPKYKYLLLEIWKPDFPDFAHIISRERTKCRHQIFKSLYENYRSNYAKKHMKHEDDIEKSEQKQIFDETYASFEGFLKLVATPKDIPGKQEMKEAIYEAEDAGAVEEENQQWESVETESETPDS